MKVKVIKLKTVLLIVLAVCGVSSFAQVKTVMYVMKKGTVVFQSTVSDVDSVTFDKSAVSDTLIIYKNDNSFANKLLLNDIQQLSFSGENLSIEMSNSKNVLAFVDIAKLLFVNTNSTGINNPSAQSGFNVLVSVTSAGDVIVESSVVIKSLSLFGIDGKMISFERYNSAMLRITSLQDEPAGVYLLRVETEQGTVVKKVVKSLNK